MPLVKAANPREIFTPDDWAGLTRVSNAHGIWVVCHAWIIVAATSVGTAYLWQWHWAAGLLSTPLALMVIGGRQLGLAILMHDGAHGLLHRKRSVNNFMGQWLTGASVGTDLFAYRAYHLTHHKYTQQAEDPDLPLSQPFPTSKASLRRKFIRDLTAQTFAKQRFAQFSAAFLGLRAMLRSEDDGNAKRDNSAGTVFNKQSKAANEKPMKSAEASKSTARAVGRFLLVQVILFALAMITAGPLAYLLWITALATTFQLFLRIRNIAEHACTPTGMDAPFTHARTIHAGFLARASVAPYWVNYHSEHHLFMGIPCYRLPAAHKNLGAGGYHQRMTIAPSYGAVLRQVSAG